MALGADYICSFDKVTPQALFTLLRESGVVMSTLDTLQPGRTELLRVALENCKRDMRLWVAAATSNEPRHRALDPMMHRTGQHLEENGPRSVAHTIPTAVSDAANPVWRAVRPTFKVAHAAV